MSKKCRADLHFNSIDELLADVESLETGEVEQCGNWSLPMILDHLDKWSIGFLDGGLPKIPKFLHPIGRWMIRRAVKSQKYPAFPIKATPGLRPAEMSLNVIRSQFNQMMERMRTLPDPVMTQVVGPLSKYDFEQMMLLHAAHHLAHIRRNS